VTNDAIYYRDGLKVPLAKRVMLAARKRIYDLFRAECRPHASTCIVDIGVSDEESDEANMLEKMHPYTSMITCAGTGSGAAILKAYPGIRFQHIEPRAPLPFRDGQFDIAYSSAVLEHVGGPEQRAHFILEALRVAKAGFIAMPHRWFPIEHHTGLPLVHFAPSLFRAALRGTRYDYWTKRENLEFLDAALLKREWPNSTIDSKLVRTGINLGWFSSNLALIWDSTK
jgi:SAM-dependent methyltransferase